MRQSLCALLFAGAAAGMSAAGSALESGGVDTWAEFAIVGARHEKPHDESQDKPQDTQEKPPDVSGTWALTVETAGGTGNPSVNLKQEGEKLTGSYSSSVFGEQKVTGSIKGNAFSFSFTGSVEGTTFTVTYTGTVDKDTMKGKVTLGDLGEGTFTGKKK